MKTLLFSIDFITPDEKLRLNKSNFFNSYFGLFFSFTVIIFISFLMFYSVLGNFVYLFPKIIENKFNEKNDIVNFIEIDELHFFSNWQ